ncbi:hypothetical protein DPMN_024985 [Dreissena polymorpha]|uniref:Uncharacterized protein n=1 Tax=Dreissena polymorpha TaxID=45954 RepID=A0A9D4LQJ5_DREPO|nr:hypothetical protein DPMN_024985 [Dreissena polymorpha]
MTPVQREDNPCFADDLSVTGLSVVVVPLDIDIHPQPHRPSGKLDRKFRIQKIGGGGARALLNNPS